MEVELNDLKDENQKFKQEIGLKFKQIEELTSWKTMANKLKTKNDELKRKLLESTESPRGRL